MLTTDQWLRHEEPNGKHVSRVVREEKSWPYEEYKQTMLEFFGEDHLLVVKTEKRPTLILL